MPLRQRRFVRELAYSTTPLRRRVKEATGLRAAGFFFQRRRQQPVNDIASNKTILLREIGDAATMVIGSFNP